MTNVCMKLVKNAQLHPKTLMQLKMKITCFIASASTVDHSRPVGDSSLIPIRANTRPSAETPQALFNPTDICRSPP